MPWSGNDWFSVFNRAIFWNVNSWINAELATTTSSVPRFNAPTRLYFAASGPAAAFQAEA